MQANEMRPGGFWRRAAAFLVDAAILGAAGYALGYTVMRAWTGTFGENWRSLTQMQYLLLVGAVALSWLYFAGFESGPDAATPGKRALGLRVEDAVSVARLEGGGVGFWRASARFGAKLVSAAILGIGFWMAAFTRRKQALHDLVTGTMVARVGGGG